MLENKYDPKAVDAAAQAHWEATGIHRFDPDAQGEVYSVDTPPPTVSGGLQLLLPARFVPEPRQPSTTPDSTGLVTAV